MFGLFKKKVSAEMQVKIDALYAEAERHLAQNTQKDREQAYHRYIEALEHLPEPREEWPQAMALFCGLGDVYFQSGDYETARQAYIDAVRCKDALGTAGIHLRLGKAQYELDEFDHAADEFCRAYLASAHEAKGMDIFQGQDPKYFEFLKTRMEPPQEGW